MIAVMTAWGPNRLTRHDAARILLGYSDLTADRGGKTVVIAPGPLTRWWRASFAFQLVLALRGAL